MVQFNVPNCFSDDCDCQGGSAPGTFCPYGDCFECTPSECEGPKCCCCASIDIALQVRSRCYDRVFYSCNIDGTSAGPGGTPFPPECSQCFDACDRALGGTEACASISQHVNNPAWQPSPPDWWTFPPAIGPCECVCVDFVDPNNEGAGCNLTCIKCAGLQCRANVEVLSGSCSYQFNLTPGTGCCGTPAIVDAVFAIDYSESMQDVISSVIDNVGQLAEELSVTGGQARFGLIVYGKDANDVTINIFSNGEILTEDVDDFEAKLTSNLPLTGGSKPDFEAAEIALVTYPWSGVENIFFLIGDERVDSDGFPIIPTLGDPNSQPDAATLIELANSLGVTCHVVQPHDAQGNPGDARKTDFALGTNGKDLEITLSFASIIDELNLNVFGASCDCLDSTPIPVQLCTGGIGPGGDECIDPDPDVPIGKCVKEDNSDCTCNEPIAFDVCGEIVIVTPDPDTLNLVCCGDIIGGGCSCSSDPICPEGCCGIACDNIDICADYTNVQDAIDAIWCECWQKAIDGEFILETPGCTRCTIPDPEDPEYGSLDIEALTNCTIKICDGSGRFFTKSRTEIATEVQAAWANCQGFDEPPPPPISASCLPKCDRPDECIIGDLTCNEENIWDCRIAACSDSNDGCTSTRNPSTAILNNGIGLVAYESLLNNTIIQIDQFHTSLPGKVLPNRKTNYGRLEHEIRWETGTTGDKLAKLYYFEEISSHFINGILGVPAEGSVEDMVVFQSGPLQNQCFSLHETSAGEDDLGRFLQLTIPVEYVLSNPFPSLDDVYDIEWFIVDSDDTGLTGSAEETADTPGSGFLLDTNAVNSKLQLSPHIHDGAPVPVANPSLAVAHNYMSAIENSHFVYLAYQALENSRWTLYMRQLRLSEYSREDIIDAGEPVSLSGLGITELIYRVVCTTDECSPFGNDFLAKRTVSMAVMLQDGRDVFNENQMTSSDSWTICPGSPAGSFPKKRVFAELTHSAIVNKCPDQFEFDDLFFNWDTGNEFAVPFTTLTAGSLFTLLRKPNDSAMEITEDLQTISGISISSSQVGAIWFDDPTLDTWITSSSETFQEILQYKGLDISEPIPITDFEVGHCTHPVVQVNHNNDVFVVYECTDPLIHQIHIVGTAMPSTSLPLGIFTPKNIDATLDYFFAPNDFGYRADITMSDEGLNQLPDMHIDANDVIHIAWQSNRDNYWEIYYANSDESFKHKRITDSQSKSLKPSITGDIRGNLHIAWHDDRFGNWEILMAYRDDERTEALFEQDPYLAGIRNSGYNHSTDVIPLVLNNRSFTDPLCISNLTVRFFEDRLRTLGAFDVAQADFPLAFQVPGMRNDRTTATWDDIPVQWTTGPETITVNGTVYDHYIPVNRSIDTALVGSDFDRLKLEFATQPQLIRFLSSAYVDENAELLAIKEQAVQASQDPNVLTTDNTQWIIDAQDTNNWLQINHLISGETGGIQELVDDFFATQTFTLPKGRYKRVEILTIGTFDVSLVEIVSVLKSRVCIAPQESITAFFDLTPSIRVDKLGNEVIETPLPVAARKNKVYFVTVLGVDDSGQLVVFDDQKRSVSCESCSEMNTPWDSASCTFPIVFSNFNANPAETKFFNARVRFYTDQEKLNLVAQFDAFNDAEGQLECFTTDDNQAAQDAWTSEGLEIFFGQRRTVKLWPLLSNTAGLLCGLPYWVEIEICSGSSGQPCVRTDLESFDLVSWICDCSSPRWSEKFGAAPVNMRDLVRWRSSGDGFSDTRLTETGMANNFNPQIEIRSDLTGLVLYESNRDDTLDANDTYTLYATAFSIFPGPTMYASGAETITTAGDELLIHSDIPVTACGGTNCDDNGPAIEGRNISFSLDQYDNIFLASEQQNDQSKCEEFLENKQQSIMVHRCGVLSRNLNFISEENEGAGVFACSGDEILGKTAPLSTDKTFKKIIKLARVSNKFAAYHITRSKRPSAVVEQCNIVIDVITEPDTIAVRLRNENGPFSVWYPFDPEIGEYTISIPWILSSISGIKTVTIEAATYQGLSAIAVITIIADYKNIDHNIKFYRSHDPSAPVPGFAEISNTELLSRVVDEQGKTDGLTAFNDANILPQLEGVPVAGIRQPTVEETENDVTIIIQPAEFIFIELIPSLKYLETIDLNNDANFPTFDVLQQGDDDLFSLPTVFVPEKNLFQGVFPVRKDDMTFYQDGLSFVIPHFKNDCSDLAAEVATGSQYTRDSFNQPIPGGLPAPGTASSTEDVWADERNALGEIKHRFDIRGTEDPYFVFGDPNYRLKKQDE